MLKITFTVTNYVWLAEEWFGGRCSEGDSVEWRPTNDRSWRQPATGYHLDNHPPIASRCLSFLPLPSRPSRTMTGLLFVWPNAVKFQLILSYKVHNACDDDRTEARVYGEGGSLCRSPGTWMEDKQPVNGNVVIQKGKQTYGIFCVSSFVDISSRLRMNGWPKSSA